MNCAQVKEQLIDYLYGELPPTAQKSFTEHLDGCPACKAEVASYQRTLDSARVALGGPLLEEPPARVHLAVMKAAKAATKQATPAKAKATSPRDELGFFARLWRTPWFLPAFGAASIATVVFLVRVLKNPEVLPGQRPHSIEERSLVAPEQAPPPEPTMAAAPAAAVEANADNNPDEAKGIVSAGRAHKRGGGKGGMARTQASGLGGGDKPTASEESRGVGGLRLDKGQASAGAPRRFAEPPPPRPAAGKKSSGDIDELLGGFKDTESTQRRAQPLVAPAANKAERPSSDEDRFEAPADRAASPAKKAPQNQPAAEVAKPAARAATLSTGAPAAAPAPKVMRDYPAESAASAPAPSAPPALRHKEMKRAEEAVEGSAKADYDDLAQDSTKDKKAKSGYKPGPSLDESVRKAERLFASQDWNAASSAYRDLLNRFPSHKDAPRWRDRMNESSTANQRALEAKRKKVQTDDPLSGSKM
jgi:anti-sigma factor RsiW